MFDFRVFDFAIIEETHLLHNTLDEALKLIVDNAVTQSSSNLYGNTHLLITGCGNLF